MGIYVLNSIPAKDPDLRSDERCYRHSWSPLCPTGMGRMRGEKGTGDPQPVLTHCLVGVSFHTSLVKEPTKCRFCLFSLRLARELAANSGQRDGGGGRAEGPPKRGREKISPTWVHVLQGFGVGLKSRLCHGFEVWIYVSYLAASSCRLFAVEDE